jgi:hypothetical protein
MRLLVAAAALAATLMIAAVLVERHALRIAERDLLAALSDENYSPSVSVHCPRDSESCDPLALAESRGGLVSAECVDNIPPVSYAGFECMLRFRDGSELWSDVWVRPGKTDVFLFL